MNLTVALPLASVTADGSKVASGLKFDRTAIGLSGSAEAPPKGSMLPQQSAMKHSGAALWQLQWQQHAAGAQQHLQQHRLKNIPPRGEIGSGGRESAMSCQLRMYTWEREVWNGWWLQYRGWKAPNGLVIS